MVVNIIDVRPMKQSMIPMAGAHHAVKAADWRKYVGNRGYTLREGEFSRISCGTKNSNQMEHIRTHTYAQNRINIGL